MKHSKADVWVTGVGIISALGTGAEENWAGLSSGISPLRPISMPESVHDGKFISGMVPLSNDEICHLTDLCVSEKHNRSTLMAIYAAAQALKSAKLELPANQIASINATTVGGISMTEKFFDALTIGEIKASEGFVNEMDCGSLSRNVSRILGLHRPHFLISTACSSSSNAIMLGARLIRSGKAEMVLAGGSDSLSRFVLNGFHALKNLDPNPCAPFDRDRFGLNLGEGAAYLLLESREHAEARGKSPLAAITGYANICETYHITGSSPDGAGAFQAMSMALNFAKMDAEEIDFIHTHGTSTIDNDLAESSAIKRLLGEGAAFGSSKVYTGHTLAASGAVSAVLSIGMMKQKFVFPTLNFKNPIPETGLSPVTEALTEQHLQNIMVNSFGFGGNNTSLIFSEVA